MTRSAHPTRRAVLTAAGSGVLVAGGCTRDQPGQAQPPRGPEPAGGPGATVAFRGPRQPGVVTSPPPFAAFVGLDLAPGADADACRRLLAVLTDDIERLMRAQPPVTDQEPELASVPAHLTVTLGVGPGFFDAAGLASRCPPWLAPLPGFSVDRLEPRWRQTDLVLQVCADSPVAVSHAARRLQVGAAPMAVPVWTQVGFREPLTATRPGLPFRNLFGQVDGTSQPALDGSDDAVIWIGAEGRRSGLQNGTSLVLRRIRMDMDRWDRADRAARENAVGRRLSDGAPVTGGGSVDLSATDELGFTVVDQAAHVRRAMPAAGQPHERILRRPYSYDDASVAGGQRDSGLLFASFQADPVAQFVPIQRRLAEADLLNLWTVPVGSAVYAVLPGALPGEVLGHTLLPPV